MALSAAAELSTGAGHLDQPAGYVPGEVLVKFRAENREAAMQGYRQRRNIQALRRFRSIGVDHLRLPESMTVAQALEIFQPDPDVIYVEPNYYHYAAAEPDDPGFNLLWGLHNTGQIVDGVAGTADADIDAPEAWDVTTGSDDVVVAVIDSGLDFSHPDLAGNVWANPGEVPGNGLDDDGNGYVDDVRGWDFLNDDNAPAPNDASAHGTHVAGTIAAVGNDGTGIAGVSWHAQIMSLRTLNAYGAGDTAAAVLAFEYANAMGADVINCSWGGAGYSQALKDAIEASSALVVCAAGNSGSDTDAVPHYPAAYDSPNIVSVAATDADDSLAAFSNYGAVSVDVAAPGVNIYSCTPGRRTLWADNFDDGNIGDWKSGGPNNDWGLTGSEAVSAPYSLADSPDGNYSQRTNSWIKAPELYLSGARNAVFEFKIKGRSEAGYDFLKVEVSTDGSVWLWQPVKLTGVGILNWVSGTIAGWTDALVDLSAYDGSPILYVRFAFLTDWTNNYDGWYIDDVAVTAASASYDGSEYQFLNGTSMAAPHVSGVAALVKGLDPLRSSAEIKSIITNTVDRLPALTGILTAGGRVNAFGAVDAPAGWGTFKLSAAAYEVAENADSATITVMRTDGSYGAVSVDYAASDGTAADGDDYTAVSGTLAWEDGDDSAKTFSVPVIADTLIEGDETVTLALGSPAGGGALGSPATATLTIVDVPVNQAPTAAEDDVDTPEDVAVTVDVLSNDTDPEGDALTIVSVEPGGHGTVVNNSGADATYTPDPDFYGSDTFSYTISDGEKTDTATVTIAVTAVNDAPVAVAGFDKTVVVGFTVTLDGSGSRDAEGDLLSYNWSFSAKPSASNSTLDPSDPVHPNFVPDAPGIYAVQLIVNDGLVASAPATVTITADLDTDNDGVPQSLDNCTAVANADQRDTDNDGYGNLCDGDLNNDGSTDTLDLQLYKMMHRTEQGDPNYDPDADFNGDGAIDTLDLNIYKGLHRRPPGPSCCGD
jgi:subtilisin family serine protease